MRRAIVSHRSQALGRQSDQHNVDPWLAALYWRNAVNSSPRGPLETPLERFGFQPGADRRLIRWDELCGYFEDIAAASDRVEYANLGPVTGQRSLVQLTISSPDNLRRLDELQAVQRRLADQRHSLDAATREDLINRGRTIVLTTCSIHPTETGGTMMTPDLVYQLATDNSPQTAAILDEVVLLLVPSLNPFGWDLVCDWYAETLDGPFEGSAPPRLYHPVAGHDNNRDWFMHVLPENRLLVEKVHNAWHPHIVHDLHQMQPTGARYFVPPFIDPYDPNVDPLIQSQANALGSEMAADLAAAGKPGVATSTMFDAYSPSRSYQHYHGGVRILSEAANARIASPVTLRHDQLTETRGFDPRQARSTHPSPWPGGTWSLGDIVEYNQIAVRSVLTHAARYRQRWVQNFARMQRRALECDRPFAFILPGPEAQTDAIATHELLRVLVNGGVEVERAESAFSTTSLDVAAGAYIVKTSQPFGRYAKTLLENRPYPYQKPAPGMAATKPYDITAHCLPLQMGVACYEIMEPFEYVASSGAKLGPPAGTVAKRKSEHDPYIFSASSNASTGLANQLLADGARVSRLYGDMTIPESGVDPGSYSVQGISASQMQRAAAAWHIDVTASRSDEGLAGRIQRMPRVGLYRSWRGNAIDAGWTDFVLQEYGFNPEALYNRDLRRGDLNARADVIVLAHESPEHIMSGNPPGDYPPQYAGGIGDVGAANLRQFAEQGGTVVGLGAATALVAQALYLPVANALDGLLSEEFSAPGSLVRLLVDPTHPLGWGFEREAVGMFVESPAFEVKPPGDASATVVARFPLTDPLVAGWMHGSEHLSGRAAVLEIEVGRGRAVLIAIRPQFRAQSRGTYRLLFNSLFRSTLE